MKRTRTGVSAARGVLWNHANEVPGAPDAFWPAMQAGRSVFAPVARLRISCIPRVLYSQLQVAPPGRVPENERKEV